MMLPQLKYKDNTILYCADLLPSVHHLPLPWVMGYDTRPLLTMEEKARLLEEAANNNYLLYFEHDAYNEMASVQNTSKGVRQQDILRLTDL